MQLELVLPPPAADPEQLRQHAARAVTAWITRAETAFGRRLPHPELRFDLRGLTAGMFLPGTFLRAACIRLNLPLLQRHPQPMLEEIVPHEVAHAVVWALHGRRVAPHGAEWRDVMARFGLAPRVRHTLPAEPARRMHKVEFRCACAGRIHRLAPVVLRRHRRGSRYRCRGCGELLHPVPGDGRGD